MSKMKRESVLESELMPPLQKSLDVCLSRVSRLLGHEVTEAEAADWKEFLGSCSNEAIEYAFQKWDEKGKLFFPKIKEILDFCREYKSENRIEFTSCGKCDSDGYITFLAPEAKARNGIQLSYRPVVVTRCSCWKEYARRRKQAA